MASSASMTEWREGMSVTWEPNTMILVPGIAARANGQRFMPMTMVSSHARVSLSTNDVSDSAVASDPSDDEDAHAGFTRRDLGVTFLPW